MAPASSTLLQWFPTTSSPFLCNAPMFGFANADLAVAVAKAGGFGFIGGGYDFSHTSNQITTLADELTRARSLLNLPDSPSILPTLPIGIGFITFRPENFNEAIIPVLQTHRPAAIWLFAPASRDQHAGIIPAIKSAGASWGLRVFVQVGNVQAAREAVEDGCDVLVVQGTDAGGHQWAQGASVMSLIPEVADMLAEEHQDADIPIIAAGGIMDGRGIAAGLTLGANGAVMGTRFVVTEECPSPANIKKLMISTADGGVSTVKSAIHDNIQGTGFWPKVYDGRAIIGESYRDHLAGLSEEENTAKYKSALAAGESTRRTVWAGSGVGLIKSVLPAGEVVRKSQAEAKEVIRKLQGKL